MSSFSEARELGKTGEVVIKANNAERIEDELIVTNAEGKKIPFTLTQDAWKQLQDVLEKAGGSRRRKSRKHKVVKRRNKSRRRHRH